MELYHLKTFVAVAEEGRLSRAAERLYVSQPSVSAHIKALEEELGLALFRRSSKGMRLTPEGDVLLEHAREALDAVERIGIKAGSLRQDVRGKIRLGLNTDSAFLRVSRLAALMGERHPQVELGLTLSVTGRIVEALRAEELDAGFTFHENDPEEFAFLRLCSFRLLIMGPAAWRDRIEDAGWEDLAGLPWIWTPPPCLCYQLGEEMFKSRQLSLTKTIEADNEQVVNDLIVAGKGVSLVREDEALAAERAGTMVRWEGGCVPQHAYLVYPHARADDPLLLALRSVVAEIWQAADARMAPGGGSCDVFAAKGAASN
ncbi:MAG: LysR family transcriptional regulator [Desulfovibrio sp.]|nr:LysR family transcriptional regulator [Desulfovibrio sp.]